MHLFVIGADGAGFAHLHPVMRDSASFVTPLPPLPAGRYRVFGDIVHESGFERTLVGRLTIDSATGARPWTPLDPDDAWFVGEASRQRAMRLADGAEMRIEIIPNWVVYARREESIRVSVLDPAGRPAALESYLGMTAHAVVVRADGQVYVHLHPMGTVSAAAQDAFAARDRGDTTAAGMLRPNEHAMHTMAPAAPSPEPGQVVEFPYAFPRAGSYRLFVQVKRNGRILTGAFAIPVVDSLLERR